MPPHLHIYREPEPSMDDFPDSPEPTVRVRLRDLLPLVAMAQRMNFIWLKDFLDDDIHITEDLHEVLKSFRPDRPRAS